ncbi:hypothetical protein [Paenibacillus medicaginis]|uniref:Uncharacterized protein n=1 Tax=Paenibacillus medicaginis TaxID=1470560 RepID=A0ABV5BYT6_9BACL
MAGSAKIKIPRQSGLTGSQIVTILIPEIKTAIAQDENNPGRSLF